jgi:arylsulfatase A-like enzyme
VAKLPTPRETDGISLLPTLIGLPQKQQHDFLYWEVHEFGSQQAVRQGDWKAVRTAPGKPLELYNLKNDKGETRDVAAQHPDVVKKFEGHLSTARVKSTYWPLRAAPKKSAKR